MCTIKKLIERQIPFAVILSDSLFRENDSYMIAMSKDVKGLKMTSPINKNTEVNIFAHSKKQFIGEAEISQQDQAYFKTHLPLFTKIELKGVGFAYEFTLGNFREYYKAEAVKLRKAERERILAATLHATSFKQPGGRVAGVKFPNGYAKTVQP